MTQSLRLIAPVVGGGRHSELLTHYDLSSIELSEVALQKGPYEIETEIQDALAVPYVLQAAIEAQREGVDAVIIDCMTDPGLNQLREALSIPVIGVAETAMHLAAQLSHRFAWIDPSPHSRVFVETQVMRYGLGGKLASFRAVNISPSQLASNPRATEEALIEQALAAVSDDGAGIIILGCTDFLGFKDNLESALKQQGKNIQVIDPTIAAIYQAAGLVKMNIGQSKYDYPTPGAIQSEGYKDIPFPGNQ